MPKSTPTQRRPRRISASRALTREKADPADISTFASAVRYLNSCVNLERMRPARVDQSVFRLDRMSALLAALDNPHRDVKCVHIAGSKGKGSVAEMTASCLGACDYTVGVFTSPHLVDVRERIRINDGLITQNDFTRLMTTCGKAAAGLPDELGEVTYFEMLTALGLKHFAEQAVDLAVIECGIGGRLDSTNLVEPEVTAITAIQLEHTAILGSTVEKIAAEKAGILKPGVTAITVPQAPVVLDVFRKKAEEVGATLLVLGEDIGFSYRFEANPKLGPHARVCTSTERVEFEHLPVPLKGEHQAYNCGLSLAILAKLTERGFETPERAVALGLAATPVNGRLEQVWDSPRIVIDGAHNPDSIHALVRAIGAHIRYDSMVVIFGCAQDKDVEGMLSKLKLGADKIIFTKCLGNPRAMDPEELRHRFSEISPKMVQTAPTLKEAINIAHRAVGRDDLICVTGSFYLAGEAKKLLGEAKAKRGK